MSLTSIAIVAGLALLTLWGVFAPRGQWRVLAAISRRSPWDGGPSAISVGIHRTVAIVATLALALTGWGLLGQYTASVNASVKVTSVAHRLWGYPTPMIVDRIIVNDTSVPDGLVRQPISHYQAVLAGKQSPAYLFTLSDWIREQDGVPDGYIGTQPPVGISALDSASIVVHVRGDSRCIPRKAVVLENDKAIAIGIFYGRPDAPEGKKAAVLDQCRIVLPDKDSVSVLIPLSLSAPVGKRTVTNLDGSPIPKAVDSSE